MKESKSEVLNIDCLEYMKTLPDRYFDLAIADPPYGIGASCPSKKPGFVRQKNETYLPVKNRDYGAKQWDKKRIEEDFFLELERIAKNRIIWGANYYGLAGGMLVWDKMNGMTDQYGCEIAYQSFNDRTDIVHYMWNGMFQGEKCSESINESLRQQGNKKLNERRIHPTQKPVALYGWLLRHYAKEGDTIFDPMMGSQSSRIAAYKLGFDYVGCERDVEYFTDGCERFAHECLGIERFDGVTTTQLTLF